MVLNNTCECKPTVLKNAYGLVHARICNGAAASLPWKLLRTYLESREHRAGSCLLPALPRALLLAILCATLFAQEIRPNSR